MSSDREGDLQSEDAVAASEHADVQEEESSRRVLEALDKAIEKERRAKEAEEKSESVKLKTRTRTRSKKSRRRSKKGSKRGSKRKSKKRRKRRSKKEKEASSRSSRRGSQREDEEQQRGETPDQAGSVPSTLAEKTPLLRSSSADETGVKQKLVAEPLADMPNTPTTTRSSEERKSRKKRSVDDGSVEETLSNNEFQKQLHKWGHHHHLPQWAEHQLFEHMTHEVERRKEMQKYYAITCGNIMKPWRWPRMWHQRHLHCKGDITFPVHGPGTAKSPMSSSASSSSDDANPENDEVLMTEDLLHEIMEDDDEDTDTVTSPTFEKAGAKGCNVWLSIPELRARSAVFAKRQTHENTIRSIAMVNPKPGDPRPGATRYNTDKKFHFTTHCIRTVFESKGKKGQKGRTLKVEKIKIKNYKKK